MTAKLMSFSFIQIIILTFILQEPVAIPLHIQQNNNATHNIKLSDYPQLNDAKILRKGLTNITNNLRNISGVFKNLTNILDVIKQLDNWAFEEISNITSSNISAGKLQSLEDSLKFLDKNVTELSLELSKETNVNEVVRKSASVQIYLNNLRKKMNNSVRHAYQLINEYFDETNIIDKYDNLTIHKRNIDMKLEEVVQTKLAEDCINAVKYDNLLTAAYLLDLIKISSKIEYIVKRLTIEQCFMLGNKVRNMTKTFMFYKAIYQDLGNRRKLDKLDVIIKLIKTIKEGIIDQAKTPTLLKEEVIAFNKHISRPLEYLILVELGIFSYPDCNEVSLKYIKEIINADYRLASEILYNAYAIYGDSYNLNCFFRRLYAKIHFSQSNALKFALCLKYIIDSCRNDYRTCDTFTSLIDELPVSVRNVVFANNVCISQARDTKFLRLDEVSHDTVRNRAISHGSSYAPQAIWKLKHLENNVFIVENVGIADTYLDTDLYNDNKSGDHAVYGWHKPPNNGMWMIELTKDLEFVYIKNLATNEVLYLSDIVNDYVYTKYMTYEGQKNFEWLISNCTDIDYE